MSQSHHILQRLQWCADWLDGRKSGTVVKMPKHPVLSHHAPSNRGDSGGSIQTILQRRGFTACRAVGTERGSFYRMKHSFTHRQNGPMFSRCWPGCWSVAPVIATQRAVSVCGNWPMPFRFEGADAVLIDHLDDH